MAVHAEQRSVPLLSLALAPISVKVGEPKSTSRACAQREYTFEGRVTGIRIEVEPRRRDRLVSLAAADGAAGLLQLRAARKAADTDPDRGCRTGVARRTDHVRLFPGAGCARESGRCGRPFVSTCARSPRSDAASSTGVPSRKCRRSAATKQTSAASNCAVPVRVISAQTPRPSVAQPPRSTSDAYSSRSTRRVAPPRVSRRTSARSRIRSRCPGAEMSAESTWYSESVTPARNRSSSSSARLIAKVQRSEVAPQRALAVVQRSRPRGRPLSTTCPLLVPACLPCTSSRAWTAIASLTTYSLRAVLMPREPARVGAGGSETRRLLNQAARTC